MQKKLCKVYNKNPLQHNCKGCQNYIIFVNIIRTLLIFYKLSTSKAETSRCYSNYNHDCGRVIIG